LGLNLGLFFRPNWHCARLTTCTVRY
jgi:hypothetical protein